MTKEGDYLTFSNPPGVPVDSISVNFIVPVNASIIIGPIEIKACKKPGESKKLGECKKTGECEKTGECKKKQVSVKNRWV